MANVRLENVSKVYKGGVKAVRDFSLEIHDKEFVVFVGPSGCGKSTTLRMIAGLENITSGNLYIGDRYMNDVEPKDRDIAMVFQNYALYPNLSVYENIAYPLRCHKMGKDEIEKRVHDASTILGIEEYLTRKPKELSGGQRQRVALGRAIVRQPKVFLLDEPLSNLDAKLRVQMRSEITKLHERLMTTFVYVTHDQTEAMTMGERIVVMKDGLIQQVDTPENLYKHPANSFVASFLGSPQMNLFDGTLKRDENVFTFLSAGDSPFSFTLDPLLSGRLSSNEGERKVKGGIRPTAITLVEKGKGLFDSKVELIERLGEQTFVYFKMPGKSELSVALENGETGVMANKTYGIALDLPRLNLFDGKTGLSLTKSGDNLILDNQKGNFLSKEDLVRLSPRMIEKNCPSDISISIPLSKLHVGKMDGDNLEFVAVIDCLDEDKGEPLAFAHESKTKTGFRLPVGKEGYKPSESITLSVPFAAIDIIRNEDAEKLTDSEPFSLPLHIGSVCFRHHGYFLTSSGEIVNHEKAYRLIRLNKLGKNSLLILKGAVDSEILAYLVPSEDYLFSGMLIQFIHKAKRQ